MKLTSPNLEKEFQDFVRQKNEPSWLENARTHALTQFQKQEMPSFKFGLSTKLDCSFSFDNVDVSELKSSNISSSNGIKILSPEEVENSDCDTKIARDISGFILNQSTNLSKFDAFSLAFFKNSHIIIIPKNTIIEKPIHLSSSLDSNASDILIIYADEGSYANIIEDINNGSYLLNRLTFIISKPRSKINYATIQNLSTETFNFTTRFAELAEGSELNWLDCCLGSKFTSSATTTILNGEGATTKTHGMFFGDSSQQFNISVSATHNAPHTVCDMLTRGVLNGKAKTVYHGSIIVNDNAFGSNGYQKDDTLLLSNDAQADAIPKLEIGNHDVRCTHGATIGHLDQEKLFYLMSRGISKEDAIPILVEGFFAPMIERIQINEVRRHVQKVLARKMNRSHETDIETQTEF